MMFPKPEPRYKEKPQRMGARKTERRSGRDRDPLYLAKVRRMECAIKGWTGHSCEGRIEADHQGTRPLGRKSHDHEAVPMCQKAHWQRTNYVGVFAGFTAVEMRAACDQLIGKTRLKLGWTMPKETTP